MQDGNTIISAWTEGLERGLVRYQHCVACGAAQTLARYACTTCGSKRLEWRNACGSGAIYATTEVMRAPSEQFRALVPYTIALVDLDEGPRVMAHARQGVSIGERVHAEFFTHGGRALLRFNPVV